MVILGKHCQLVSWCESVSYRDNEFLLSACHLEMAGSQEDPDNSTSSRKWTKKEKKIKKKDFINNKFIDNCLCIFLKPVPNIYTGFIQINGINKIK